MATAVVVIDHQKRINKIYDAINDIMIFLAWAFASYYLLLEHTNRKSLSAIKFLTAYVILSKKKIRRIGRPNHLIKMHF